MLSDLKFVAEDYRTDDLLGFDEYISQLLIKIDTSPSRLLIGIVGDYGTGKSVMLENLKQNIIDDIHWVHFDAWKYPERNNLWEGFVLDFVKQVSPKDFEKVLKKMDGTSHDAARSLIRTFGTAADLFVKGSKGAIDKLTYFTNTSPIKRIFQIQDIFQNLLEKKAKKAIYVVVEDADRSGDAGIYFIETLSQFLKNIEVDNVIKVFVPISRKSFLSDDYHDAYVKALDQIEFFDLKNKDLTKFVEKVFNPDLLSNEVQKHHFVEWLQRLVTNYGLTIRDLKLIIRTSASQYKALQAKGHHPDARVVLVIESTRYIEDDSGGPKQNAYEYIQQNLYRIRNNTQVEMILFAIGYNVTTDNMVDVLNNANGENNIFRRPIRFVNTNTYLQANRDFDNGKPIEYGGLYSLPLYYLTQY